MDRGNVLSGSAFSAVLLSAVTFLVVLISVGFAAHSYVDKSLRGELREDVQARWSLFVTSYQDEGADSLIGLVDSAALFTFQGQRAIGLFDTKGRLIAGNVLSRPDARGWQEAPLVLSSTDALGQAAGRKIDYLYFSDVFDGHTLVVGQRMDSIVLTNHTLLRTLAIVGFVVVLSMLSIGYYFSHKSQSKLEGLEAILARISAGDTTARMVLSPANDQIDRIAGRVNTHLDTLSRLTIATRTTAAAVAHDLKSPLARAYMGLGRALARIEAGMDPRAEIEDTQAELERMNGIFDSFLRLSRIEAGADGAQFAKVDLGALLDDLAETYQMVAEDNGQNLFYERAGGDPFTVSGDAAMLQQLVINLLQNAVTHGGIGNQIRLSLERVEGHIRLTVADHGPGIPEAARDAVFEPFHRLDPSRNKPGSGLGLALVRAIAERHGAAITLSDNAPGLRVEVVFPAG